MSLLIPGIIKQHKSSSWFSTLFQILPIQDRFLTKEHQYHTVRGSHQENGHILLVLVAFMFSVCWFISQPSLLSLLNLCISSESYRNQVWVTSAFSAKSCNEWYRQAISWTRRSRVQEWRLSVSRAQDFAERARVTKLDFFSNL